MARHLTSFLMQIFLRGTGCKTKYLHSTAISKLVILLKKHGDVSWRCAGHYPWQRMKTCLRIIDMIEYYHWVPCLLQTSCWLNPSSHCGQLIVNYRSLHWEALLIQSERRLLYLSSKWQIILYISITFSTNWNICLRWTATTKNYRYNFFYINV